MRGVYLKKGNVKVTVVPYYRIGDLFLTTNAANPSSFLGGTWELFGPGRCLVCVDSLDDDFKTVKKTGGSKAMQRHNHTGWTGTAYTSFMRVVLGNEMVNRHAANHMGDSGNGNYYDLHESRDIPGGNHIHDFTTNDSGTGNSGNLQPYITCYVWIRTA